MGVQLGTIRSPGTGERCRAKRGGEGEFVRLCDVETGRPDWIRTAKGAGRMPYWI